MSKGMNSILAAVVAVLIAQQPVLAQVYKIVDEDGNVTYTDQAPEEGATPMALPDISIVDTDYPDEAIVAPSGNEQAGDESEGMTPREMRRMFSDFSIIRPLPDETFWGTANTVVISWGSSAPYEAGMSVSVFIDGEAQAAAPSGNLSVTLDRGAHQVYAVLRDQRGRRIVTTPTVTFHVRQASANFNPS